MILIFAGCALLIAALSIPLILGRIPPNELYGFRTERTVRDPAVWYPANRHSGWQLLYAAMAQLVVLVVVWLMADRIAQETAAIVLVSTLLGTVVVAAVRSFLHLRQL